MEQEVKLRNKENKVKINCSFLGNKAENLIGNFIYQQVHYVGVDANRSQGSLG